MDLLGQIARQILQEKGFLVDFSPDELAEAGALKPQYKEARDLTQLHWISIDNVDSKDLDQITYAEGNRIYVAVADVDAYIQKGGLLDLHAAHNTTSIYTPSQVFPMLPSLYSNNLTSLNPGVDRHALVTEMEVDAEGGFHLREVYPALVHNREKLNYPQVSEWIKKGVKHPQVDLQHQLAQKIKARRLQEGALQFRTIELVPVMRGSYPVELEQEVPTVAHELIEYLMISANSCLTAFFKAQQLPLFKRVVKTPKRWDRIQELALEYGYTLPDKPDVKELQRFLIGQRQSNPKEFPDLSLAVIKLIGRGEYILVQPEEKNAPGHFDLALQEYAHTTAPNRRYPDLIMQRLFKGVAYTRKELSDLVAHCSLKEDEAARAERRVMKSAYAMVLSRHIGESFGALVTGVNENGTWVRLDKPLIEGKLVEGYSGLDVGDRVKVKLLKTDVKKGYIDFKKL